MSDEKVLVAITEERTLLVNVSPETAEWLLDRDEDGTWVEAECVEITDLSDLLESIKRISHGRIDYADASVQVEPGVDRWPFSVFSEPIDASAPEGYYWTARHHVGEARRVLSQGRYREGNCREMDAANAALGQVEEQLRKLAAAVDEARQGAVDA